MLFRFLLLIAVCGRLCASPEGNWPRFRGPNGNGKAIPAMELPSKWSEQSSAWSVQLPGEGNSSPVIWGTKVFVTSAINRGEKRLLLCFERDSGKEIWRKEQDGLSTVYYILSGQH